MGTHARIMNGYLSIDTTAWIEQRTAGALPDLTDDLHAWATTAASTPSRPRRDWPAVVLAWCAARGYSSPDPRDRFAGPLVICHEGTRLDRDVWLALATRVTRDGRDGDGIVVVHLDQDVSGAPVVFADAAREVADWFDADTVVIGCPNGHGWWWRSGRELLTADGVFTTLTVVFGPNLDAPFTRCGDCIAHDTTHGAAGGAGRRGAGDRAGGCGCDGTAWIVCPTCGARCDVDLPPL